MISCILLFQILSNIKILVVKSCGRRPLREQNAYQRTIYKQILRKTGYRDENQTELAQNRVQLQTLVVTGVTNRFHGNRATVIK
jgi:hypothetical protein